MVDFLKANPYLTKEDYMWGWSVPQIKLASYDYSHVVYLTDEQINNKNAQVIGSGDDLVNDLGVPMINKKQ